MIVEHLALRHYRSYERLELDLEPGTVLVVGENGAGKTNLLEALHVGTQGFSPRTRVDGQLVRFEADAARVAVTGREAGVPVQVEVTVGRREGKRVRVNGAATQSADELRQRLVTLVFTPDRLAVVKGGPAVRRAYFDRTLGRLLPARAGVPGRYAAAVSHRNAALRRAAAGHGPEEAIAPWTEQVAALGAELVEARARTVAELAPPFAEAAAELGLDEAQVAYDAEPPTTEQLDAQLARDLERGWTGAGPHLDDVGLTARRTRPAPVRLAGRAAADRPVAAARRGRAAQGARSPAVAAPGRRPVRARHRPPACARRPGGARRADRDHGDCGEGTSGRRSAGRRGRARPRAGERAGVKRIGDDVERELARFPVAAGMAAIVAAWPAAVGPAIARNSCPARLARDGTLHVATSSSTWAFELTQLSADILERLRAALPPEHVPRGVRWAPGRLPEAPADEPGESGPPPAEPDAEALAEGARLAAPIGDESLRSLVARAAAASLSREPSDRLL